MKIVRPWNSVNTKKRENGKYYDVMFSAALSSFEKMKNNSTNLIVAITSKISQIFLFFYFILLFFPGFNEWGEGSQIEDSVPYESKSHVYENYLPNDPDFYMKKTKDWINLLNFPLNQTQTFDQ